MVSTQVFVLGLAVGGSTVVVVPVEAVGADVDGADVAGAEVTGAELTGEALTGADVAGAPVVAVSAGLAVALKNAPPPQPQHISFGENPALSKIPPRQSFKLAL